MASDPHSLAYALAAATDDVILSSSAREIGLTHWAQESLRRGGDLPVPRGTLVIPPVRDPLRTRARATQLLLPTAVLSHTTAAHLHGVQGVGFWDPDQPIHATVPSGATRWQRRDVRLHFAQLPDSGVVDLGGLSVASVFRTLLGCGQILPRAQFVSLVDSALYQGKLPEEELERLADELRRHRLRAAGWVGLADKRAESPSETRVRLVLGDGGVLPDELQVEVWTEGGFHVARLDIGWTHGRRKVGMEVQSGWHDQTKALYRDREKLNALSDLGWDIRQVTGRDADVRPGYIVQQAKQALGLR